MKDVAVVILNYNGQKFLDQFLSSFLKYCEGAELIVADNRSTDESVTFLKDRFPEVRIVQLDENRGFAGGYNQALKQVEAGYYAIVNSDIEVTEHWLEHLTGFLDSNEEYGAVQPKIKAFGAKNHFEYAGACGGFIDRLGYPYCRGRIFDHIEKDQGQYDRMTDVDWTSGACMVIRSEVFWELNGFDEDFFAHMEEIDLCWRARAHGWKLACIPDSTVYHVGGGTLSKTSPRKTYLNFRNGLSLLLKNLPWSEVLWKIPLRLVLDGLAGIKFAIETSPAHLVAVVKAHFHFYARIPRNIRKRKRSLGMTGSNILIQYFLRGKKTYSDL